jgi:hypothetical protein
MDRFHLNVRCCMTEAHVALRVKCSTGVGIPGWRLLVPSLRFTQCRVYRLKIGSGASEGVRV